MYEEEWGDTLALDYHLEKPTEKRPCHYLYIICSVVSCLKAIHEEELVYSKW